MDDEPTVWAMVLFFLSVGLCFVAWLRFGIIGELYMGIFCGVAMPVIFAFGRKAMKARAGVEGLVSKGKLKTDVYGKGEQREARRGAKAKVVRKTRKRAGSKSVRPRNSKA